MLTCAVCPVTLSLDIASRLCCCFSLVHRWCWHVEEDGRCAACGADTRCVFFLDSGVVFVCLFAEFRGCFNVDFG